MNIVKVYYCEYCFAKINDSLRFGYNYNCGYNNGFWYTYMYDGKCGDNYNW